MSSTISKLTASLISGSQETTVALASLNFDFSLVKVEAPVEFQGLGSALSSRRRESAEDGLPHITARKLGALFEDLIPPIPTLIKAYGTRASEIAASSCVNPKGTKEHGFWKDYMGVDGTTIWAAATSGKGAIAVHLLACMLARIWTGPEATSIWVELVAQRKQELARTDCNESVYLSNMAASQVILSREQLRSWDTSARSWLQSADKEKNHQQLQLMLILNNIKLPVNSSMDVYCGVLQTWKMALTTAEDLLCGKPQRVQDGAILLGISAWHIYPDMLVLGDCNTKVDQNDPLVSKGGVLTIGIKVLSRDKDDGVFWSLPLSHLRYYGDPVPSTRSIGTSTSRIPFEDLMQVALGSACSRWSKGRGDMSKAARLIVSLKKYISKGSVETLDHDIPKEVSRSFRKNRDALEWFVLLFDAASVFLKSSGPEHELLSRLASLGQRRAATFLAASGAHPAPYFGLADYGNVFKLIDSEEDRIEILRNIAKDLKAEPDDLIIRYHVASISSLAYEPHYEYASALPVPRTSIKRTQEGQESSPVSHTRWILDPDSVGEPAQNKKACICIEKCLAPSCYCIRANRPCLVGCHRQEYHDQGAKYRCNNTHRGDITSAMLYKASLLEREGLVDRRGECRHNIRYVDKSEDLMFIWDSEDLSVERPAQGIEGGSPNSSVAFKILLGDPGTAAIFRRQDRSPHLATQFQLMEDQSILEMILKQNLLPKIALTRYMAHLLLEGLVEDQNASDSPDSPEASNAASDYQEPRPQFVPHIRLQYFYSLTALSVARSLYHHLPDASVDLAVTTKPLHAMTWVPAMDRTGKVSPMTKEQAFSCIALFQTGHITLLPQSMGQVMALSSGNSLFVSTALLQDPWEVADYGGVRRLAGNIGKAGLILLVPPPKPRIGNVDLSTWGVINHNDFDGKVEDCFRSTSLHLSFTDYQLPIDTGAHGNRDGEAFFLESLVSVLDRGEWVADIDVLGMIESKNLFRIPDCNHSRKELYTADKMPGSALISLESWPEFLDPPNGGCITHTASNSYARLATAAISIQKGNETLILRDDKAGICWPCVYKHSKFCESEETYSEDDEDELGNKDISLGIQPKPWILIA